MPTYEYACRACGEHREVVQSFSDDALTVCESCGGELRKVYSAAGLIFKGSGWHVKDYASGGKGSGSGTSSPGTSGTTNDGAKKDASDGAKKDASSTSTSSSASSGSSSSTTSSTSSSSD